MDEKAERLVVQMAKENPGWKYDRIVGALANLGFQLSFLKKGVFKAVEESGKLCPNAVNRGKTSTEINRCFLITAAFAEPILSSRGTRC
jgi:hypothetical protein